MLEDLLGGIKEFFKVLWEIFWTLFSEFWKVVWEDFRPIVFALLAAAILWYLFGGYDRAEQAYQARKAQGNQQELQNSAPAPSSDGKPVYIIR